MNEEINDEITDDELLERRKKHLYESPRAVAERGAYKEDLRRSGAKTSFELTKQAAPATEPRTPEGQAEKQRESERQEYYKIVEILEEREKAVKATVVKPNGEKISAIWLPKSMIDQVVPAWFVNRKLGKIEERRSA